MAQENNGLSSQSPIHLHYGKGERDGTMSDSWSEESRYVKRGIE
jgi:hypothetical protein